MEVMPNASVWVLEIIKASKRVVSKAEAAASMKMNARVVITRDRQLTSDVVTSSRCSPIHQYSPLACLIFYDTLPTSTVGRGHCDVAPSSCAMSLPLRRRPWPMRCPSAPGHRF